MSAEFHKLNPFSFVDHISKSNAFNIFRLFDQQLLPDSSYESLAEDSMERKAIDMDTEFYANFAKYS